jgi:hypothetical protein
VAAFLMVELDAVTMNRVQDSINDHECALEKLAVVKGGVGARRCEGGASREQVQEGSHRQESGQGKGRVPDGGRRNALKSQSHERGGETESCMSYG